MNPDFLNIFQSAKTEPVSPEVLKTTWEAVEQYPYFSLAHTVLAKANEYEAGKPTGNELLKAAAYSPNRDLLKAYILYQQVEAPQVLVTEPEDEASEAEGPLHVGKHTPASHETASTETGSEEENSTPAVETSPLNAVGEKEDENIEEASEAEGPLHIPTAKEVTPKASPSPQKVGINWGMNTRIRIRVRQNQGQASRIRKELDTFLATYQSPELETATPTEIPKEEEQIQVVEQEAASASKVMAETVEEETVTTAPLPPAAEDTPMIEQPIEEAPPVEMPMFELDLSSNSGITPVDTPAEPEMETNYEISSFSHLSFFEPDVEEKIADTNSAEEEEEIGEELATPPEEETEWNGIIMEEPSRILEVSVTPDQINQYFSPDSLKETSELVEAPASVEETAGQVKTRVDDEKVQSIIEKFLENEPTVSQPAPTTRQENLAAESAVEDEDLVTETLAIIHAKQGNITKATKIYERLGLLFPEKKSYFAQQILKLKK